MLFRATFLSAVALLGINQAIGAALEPRSAEIATSPYYACNCPNNCSHKQGSSCKYYVGNGSPDVSGNCEYESGELTCVG